MNFPKTLLVFSLLSLGLVSHLQTKAASPADVMPSPPCLEQVEKMYEALDKGLNVDDFHRLIKQELASSTVSNCGNRLLLLWASTYAVDFNDPLRSSIFIDSLAETINPNKDRSLWQTLMVRQASNWSDLERVNEAKGIAEILYHDFQEGELLLHDTSTYFVLSAVLHELELTEESTRVLLYAGERFGGDPSTFWRSKMHLMLNAVSSEDYESAIRYFEEALPLTDTSLLNRYAIAEFYTVGALAFLGAEEWGNALHYALLAQEIAAPFQEAIISYNLITICESSYEQELVNKDTLCEKVLLYADDAENLIHYRREAYKAYLGYAESVNLPLNKLRAIYRRWEDITVGYPIKQKGTSLSLRKVGLRLELYESGQIGLLAQLDSITTAYDQMLIDETKKINKDLTTFYETRIKEDSITYLQKQNQLITDQATTRTWQLLSIGILSIALIIAVIRLARENRINQILNKKFSTLYNSLGHTTINQFDAMINSLKRQQKKLQQNPSARLLSSVEQQLLSYSTIQKLIKQSNDIAIDLSVYLNDLSEALEVAHYEDLALRVQCPQIAVDATFAAELGNILNELITNSIKYATRDARVLHLDLVVTQARAGYIQVNYSDPGRAEKKSNPEKLYSSNSGVELVRELTAWLQGVIIQYGEENWDYIASFPIEND